MGIFNYGCLDLNRHVHKIADAASSPDNYGWGGAATCYSLRIKYFKAQALKYLWYQEEQQRRCLRSCMKRQSLRHCPGRFLGIVGFRYTSVAIG
jgi:hypothetical protein